MAETDQVAAVGRRAFALVAGIIAISVVVMAVDTLVLERHLAVLRVGFSEFRPYISVGVGGVPTGLAVDLIRAAAVRSGQQLKWVPVRDAKEAFAAGQIDMYPLLPVTTETVRQYHFSDYWWQNTLELVSRQSQPMRSAEDTRGRKVGLRIHGVAGQLARSLLPDARLVLLPNIDDAVNSLCRGEVEGVLADSRMVERPLFERSTSCVGVRLKAISVRGATVPLGTASTWRARNRAKLLFDQIVETVADGTLAKLAAGYQITTPDNNLRLMQLVRNREDSVMLKTASAGLCCLSVFLLMFGLQMRFDKRAAEEARVKLTDSEQRFHAFMDHAAAVAYIKDSGGRFIYINQACRTVFKVAPGDLLGKTNEEWMAPEIAGPLLEHDRIVRESNVGHEFHEVVPDLHGQTHHWLSYKFPFHGLSGESFLGGVSIEITEMMRAQQALRESEARYRQIVEYAGDIIVRCDHRGRINYINEMGARVLKYPAIILQGRRAFSLITRRERRRIFSILREELTGGGSDFYVEVPIIRGDGSEIWLGQTLRVLRTGRIISGFQAISCDITQRRRMEAELRASEERFRLLYENGPVAYHEIDRNGVIRRVNRAECEMFGIAEEELVGRPVAELLADEDREVAMKAIASKVNEQVPLHPFQRTYVRRDGRMVLVEIHENLLRDAAGSVIGIHSVLLDVTQRHRSELLDRDRREVSEMIAQQQPLDRILLGVSRMISHQDESLCCIPMCLATDEEARRLEPGVCGETAEELSDAMRQLGSEAFLLWPVEGFRVSCRSLTELAGSATSAALAEKAAGLGMRSCWSIPILSSSRNALGVLVVFSALSTEPAAPEIQLLEAASRLAAIAIEHRFMTDLLAFQAGHDSLTRLPNRGTFESRLESAIAQVKLDGDELAVFFVDLDRFKQVNDTFGHGGGDELLRQVAGRLRGCIRHGDTIARVGGDEFSLLLPGLGEPDEANRVAEAILQAFRRPFEIGGVEVGVTASIGISIYPRDGLDATTLQRHSDTAMYRVKNSGKNNFRCYASESRGRADKRRSAERVA
jgi:diguanylate cyclase (GGDEF)-like protein/PAS domain S-box-containing protein